MFRHALTYRDIYGYIVNRLQHPRCLSVDDKYAVATWLTVKAEGVFLWVRMALSSVLRCQRSTLRDELMNRVDRLPNKIVDDYEKYSSRAEDDTDEVKREAATYLKLSCDCFGDATFCMQEYAILRSMLFGCTQSNAFEDSSGPRYVVLPFDLTGRAWKGMSVDMTRFFWK